VKCPECDLSMTVVDAATMEHLSGGSWGASPELMQKVLDSNPTEYYCKQCDIVCDEDGEVIEDDEDEE